MLRLEELAGRDFPLRIAARLAVHPQDVLHQQEASQGAVGAVGESPRPLRAGSGGIAAGMAPKKSVKRPAPVRRVLQTFALLGLAVYLAITGYHRYHDQGGKQKQKQCALPGPGKEPVVQVRAPAIPDDCAVRR